MNLPMLLTLAVPVLCGAIIPSATDVICKSAAPRWLKSSVCFALSTLAGALSTVSFGQGERWQDYILAVFAAWATAIASHYAGTSVLVQRATARFGLGPRRALRAPYAYNSDRLGPSLARDRGGFTHARGATGSGGR